MDYIVIYSERYSDGDEKQKQITTVSLPDSEHNVADAIAMMLGGRYGIHIWHYAEATPTNVRKLETRFEDYMREEREEEERRRVRWAIIRADAERRNALERQKISYWFGILFEHLEETFVIGGIILGLLYIVYLFYLD